MSIVAPEQQIGRDRFGRPLVTPPEGGKPVPYTRCTTFVDCIEDKFNLQQWMSRMVAIGLASRPDLLLAVSAHQDDKKQLNKICEDAKEAAAANAAATTGTALHALTERVDRGQELGVIPEAYIADIAAYTEATQALKPVYIEQFTVCDPLKIGGTPDRIVEWNGKRYIADVKTGSIEYGTLKIAAQLAVYARSHLYDIPTGKRSRHDAEIDRGLIIHLPAGTGTCTLVWVDLLEGWQAVQVARQVREKRALKFADLTEPFNAPALTFEAPAPLPLEQQIRECLTDRAVRELWQTHAAEWTDDLTEVAKAHIASLQKASA